MKCSRNSRQANRKGLGVLAILLAVGATRAALGQCEVDKLLASDGAADDLFGRTVSISGDVAIVSADRNDDNGSNSGSAYIYRFNPDTSGWVEEAKLLPSDGTGGDLFGNSVSISGVPGNEVAIVGAKFDDDRGTDSGSAYIYRFNPESSGWVEEVKLLPSDGRRGDVFGWSVSISGVPGNEVAIVGAYGDDDNGSLSGSAYIFRFNPDVSRWVEEAKLLPSDGTRDDQFGWSVSVDNNVAVVGAWANDDNGTNSGSAYIYRFDPDTSDWIEEAKLLASDAAAYDLFGRSVSISGAPGNPGDEVAIVGAWANDDNGTNSGSAYIYRFDPDTSGWIEEAKLLASDGAGGEVFGSTVSISSAPGDEVAIVGAVGDVVNGVRTGSAYIYSFNPDISGWIEADKLLASDGAADDSFGASVSVSGKVAIVGALRNDDNGTNSGSAYIFGVSSAVCCPNDLNGDGVVNVADLLRLIGVGKPPHAPGPPDGSNHGGGGGHGRGRFDVADLLALLAAWGPCP